MRNGKRLEQEGGQGGFEPNERLARLFRELYTGKTADQIYQELDGGSLATTPSELIMVAVTVLPVKKVESIRVIAPLKETPVPESAQVEETVRIINKGIMPNPFWIELPSITDGTGNEVKRRFVGIEAHSIEGVNKRFAWWTNLPNIPLILSR